MGSGIDPEDVVHARLIVLWGTNTVVTNLHYWPLIREAQRRGARLIVVDPIRTRTAEAADWRGAAAWYRRRAGAGDDARDDS